ncbi:PIN domain-containing protein [Candidatus Aerophobetes bacterium]|nr:PIN domain-containing protein [Candidatus Aerophobetes bacterium]
MRSVYLDASTPSAYYERSQLERLKITRRWWRKIGEYKVFISTLTLEEIKALENRERKEAILSLLSNFSVLKITAPVKILSKNYIEAKIIPLKAFNDAVHLSIAVVNKINILLSWDFTHLVKKEIERKVNIYNITNGYSEIQITSPKELL